MASGSAVEVARFQRTRRPHNADRVLIPIERRMSGWLRLEYRAAPRVTPGRTHRHLLNDRARAGMAQRAGLVT